jgi:NitT/TauT family transport system substrate-binding protein
MLLHLAENFRAVFYAPFYATQALGFYAAEELELQLLDSPAPGAAIAGLLSGDIDVTWAGPMRVIKDRDGNAVNGSSLVCFCEVVTRDPFFLVGRNDAEWRRPDGFRLTDLARLRVGSVSEVVTPWLCLQQDLRDAGVDPASVDRVTDQSMRANLDALREGRLDVAQLFEPYVSMALAEGWGSVLHTASERGPTSYTSLIATRDGVERKRPALRAAIRATARMQQWLDQHDAQDLAAVVAPYFPQVAPALLGSALQRYAGAGIWSKSPTISRPGYARLALSVRTGGLVRREPAYESCVVEP